MFRYFAVKPVFNSAIVTGAVCILAALMIGIEATQVSPFLNSVTFNESYGKQSDLIIGLITGLFPLFSCCKSRYRIFMGARAALTILF